MSDDTSNTAPSSGGFGFENFWSALQRGASHLVTLAAGAETTIHRIQADAPIIATVLNLLEKEFPGVSQVVGIAQTVLAAAQATVNALQSSVAAAGPAPAVATAPASAAQGATGATGA